jgi:diguanylate cyclase (GGDEF)-like protein
MSSRRITENRVRMGGIINDITDRKRAEEKMQQANEQLVLWVNELKQRNSEATLLNEMGDLLQSCVAIENVYMIVKQFGVELFPEQSGALYILEPDVNILEVVSTWGNNPARETEFTPDACWALRRNRIQSVTDARFKVRCDHVETELPFPYLCIPMMAQSEILGMLHIRGSVDQPIENLTQLASMFAGRVALAISNLRLSEKLRRQSIRDPLTNLFNRRYMEEMMKRELRRATRHNRPIGVIMMDIDHFKDYNDQFGHTAGDVMLRKFGSFLHVHIRGEDIACRYGGEEFIAVLVEASLSDTLRRAHLLCEGISQISVYHGELKLTGITASLGVASFPEHGETMQELIEAADKALYRAKRNGRNQVMVAE